MPRLNFNSDRGSAPLEIIGFGVLLMVPIMWFAINLLGAQNDQFAATAIAEHGLRAWAQADHPDSINFEIAVRQIAADFHEPKDRIKWMIDCAGIEPCAPRGQVVRLTVQVRNSSATAAMRWAK